MQKNFRVTETDETLMRRLKKAKVGPNETAIFRMGLVELANKHGVKVPEGMRVPA